MNNSVNKVRVNHQIRGYEVRVVEPNLGVITFNAAIKQANEDGLDLIEISSGEVPVCVIKDYGKYKYEQEKKSKASRQKILDVKQIQIRPVTDVGDMQTKARQAKEFLEEGHKVRLVVRLHGRELAHEQEAQEALDRLIEMCDCTVESRTGLESKQIVAIVGKKKIGG